MQESQTVKATEENLYEKQDKLCSGNQVQVPTRSLPHQESRRITPFPLAIFLLIYSTLPCSYPCPHPCSIFPLNLLTYFLLLKKPLPFNN